MPNIEKLRSEAGLTQKDLAKHLGVTQGAVSQWELGLTCPNIKILPAMARVLGCTVDALLDTGEQSAGLEA